MTFLVLQIEILSSPENKLDHQQLLLLIRNMEDNKTRNDCRWTNERHLCYLKSVEASFVRTMFEKGDRRVLRMDRYMPDSCESTVDSKITISTRRRKRRFSDGMFDTFFILFGSS